jgi:hypothetical protein
MDSIKLRAVHLLDDDWEPVADVAPDLHAKSAGPDDQVRDWIRSTFVEIAPHAETVQVVGAGNADAEYLKSEVGMNIILPHGYIDELRFKISLVQLGGNSETFAQDGFPNSSISSTAFASGQVKLGISKAFKFIPVVGGAIDELLSVNINPWNFRIGTLKHVNVAFNGGLTTKPEWYFRRAGIRNDTVRVAMLLKKAPGTASIVAEIQAGWLYRTGTMGSRRVGSDTKTVVVFNADEAHGQPG